MMLESYSSNEGRSGPNIKARVLRSIIDATLLRFSISLHDTRKVGLTAGQDNRADLWKKAQMRL